MGLPRTGPARTCPSRPKAGPASMPTVGGPQTQGGSLCSSDLDLPGHGPQKGQDPSRPHGASSYLQTETGRSEVAAARVAPGPPAPTPSPAAPSPAPHGFLFPSPHSSPTSHCPGQLSLDNLPGPHSDPHTPRPRPFSLLVGGGGGPLQLLTPTQDPMSLGFLEQPPPTRARPTLACPKHIPTVLSSPS